MCLFNHRAFTLLEMLVVVIIMGILASIAIPSYLTAVDKARFVKLMSAVDTLAEAEEAYYLQHRQYTTRVLDLDVKLNYPLRAAADVWDRDQSRHKVVTSYDFPGGGYAGVSHTENYDFDVDDQGNYILDDEGNPIFNWRQERYVWGTTAGIGSPRRVSYFRFLQHRADKPGTRWCSAAADNERMNKLCRSMGGVPSDSGYTTGNWYLLP